MKQKMFRHGNCLLLSAALLTCGLFCTSFDNPDALSENSSSNLIYALDFSDSTNLGKNTSGTQFTDAILQDNNTISVVEGPQGKKAISLPGGTQKVNYLELPTDIFENQDVVSISSWYYLPTGVESYLGEIGIYSPESDVAFRSDPYASFHDNDYIFCVGNPSDGDKEGGYALNLDTNVAPVYDAWYHMTYVIDGINHVFKVYENGDLVLTQALDSAFSPSQFATETAHFYLGQSSYAGYHNEGDHNDYQGKIADFRVYSEALDETEIETLYNFSANDFLTDEWTFDSQETYLENNKRDYDLSIYRDPSNTNHSFVMDNVADNGYITIDNGAALVPYAKQNDGSGFSEAINPNFISGFSEYTISMDINVQTSTSEDWKRIIDLFGSMDDRLTYMVYCPRIDNNKFLETNYYGADLAGDNSFTLENHKWLNFTTTFADDKISVYVDGELRLEALVKEDQPHSEDFLHRIAKSGNGNIVIGSNSYEEGNNINAFLDNIRFYSKAADSTNIKDYIGGEIKTVKLHSNYGADSVVEPFVKADEITLKGDTFTREGYVLSSWNTKADGTGTSYEVGSVVSTTEPVELYAIWDLDTYEISLNANTGNGEDILIYVDKNTATLQLPKNTFTKEGHDFVGWNTKADGTGTSYSDGATIENIAGNIVLYAQWEAKEYNISFDSNGGEGTLASITAKYGEDVTLPANTFTREHYTFDGWSLTSEGIVAYEDKAVVSSINDYEDVTLYAVWQINTYTISFDANGGTGTMNSISADALSYVTLPEVGFENDGYVFAGWATSKDGEVVYENADSFIPDGDTTLYAVWEDESTDSDNPTDPNEPTTPNDNPVNIGAIVGGVIGGVAGVGIIGGVVYFFVIKRKKI